MPLTRYQIRNEYSLADPELYKAADRDDPEALLEGVAMAGLVGVLRQLGDLAEFAAEIFHDLHEEVMATAARGHGLMVRVQQLEAEFPSIEKAFLSQTNHTSFFSNAGVDWHPNLRTEQNLITRGDLPRCVMDSYEECRGPPRLFLLDKFDVAGAGACLKRYTDPSFFKVETAPSEPSLEVHREKKFRKVKKKGSRWKNGETPEIVPASHAKLHQLFLEESVEKGLSDPARLVKLKKRQLDASPFNSRSGKSYMEKFLETPPERDEVREISVNPLPLKMASDYSSESGLEIYEITTVSPVKEKSQRKESTCSSPNAHEVVLKPSMDKLYGNDRQIVMVPEPGADGEREEIPSIHPKLMVERDIAVDGEGKREGSVDEDNSDDMTSEVDNYMDALTTMESEMETDHVYRPKSDSGFLNVAKRGVNPDRNGELLKFETHSSDSQSIGNVSASDDGNNSLKKGRSSFSCSDTLSNLGEILPSDGEGSAIVVPASEAFMPEHAEAQSNQFPEDMAVRCIDEDNISSLGEVSGNSSLADSNHPQHPLDPTASSMQHHPDETPSEPTKLGSALSHTDERETNLAESSAIVTDTTSQTTNGSPFTVSVECHSLDKLDGGDCHISSYVSSHLSNYSELAPEDFAEKSNPDNTVNIKIGSPRSNTSSPTEEQVHYSILSEVEDSDVGKRDDLVSEDVDALPETEVYRESDTSQNCNFQEQHISDIVDDVPQDELESVEETPVYSEEANTYCTADIEKIGASTCNVDAVDQEAVPREFPSNYQDCSILEDHAGLDDVVAEGVLVENMAVSASDVPAEAIADDDVDVVYPLQDSLCSPSNDTVNSDTEDPLKDGLEFNKVVSHDCLTGLEAENETTQMQVAPKVFDSASCKLISHDESNSEMVKGVQNSSAEVSQNSLLAGDVTIPPTSSGLSDQELESESLHQSHLLDGGANAMSLPAVQLPDPETSSEQPLELQTNQLDSECMAAKASPNSPDHLSEQIQSSIHTDQQRLFNDVSESCQANLPNELSPCGYLQQSTGLEINITEQELDPLSSVFPSSGLLPEAAQVNLEEMPPLPPLPPMQWRLGKIQHAPLSPQREFMDHSQESFPSILPFRDHEKAQSAFPAEQSDIMQSANPFLPVSVVEVEKPNVPERVGDAMQPTLSPLQLPFMAEDANSPNSHPLEGTQSLNPFLTEKPDHGSLASEHEVVQLSSNPFLSLPANEDTASEYDPVSSSEKLIHSLNQSASEPGLPYMSENFEGEHGNSSDKSALPPIKVEDTASKNGPVPSPGKPIHLLNQSVSEPSLQHTSENLAREHGNPFDGSVLPPRNVEDAASNYDPVSSLEKPIHPLKQSASEPGLQHTSEISEEEHGNPSDTSVPPPRKVEEQPHRGLSSSEGKSTWPSNPFALLTTSEVGHANGSSTVKLPRPRNPLIDAVAAHDKSKLRKVTERVRPQSEPKVDERNSLLEQIRTKSFNLKPALVSRPSIQGPKTNLRVAAILEKANAIRQATAGSDEDDDEDWSDS